MDFKYKNSLLGGTFDRLHLGHHKLIDEAFNNSKKITVGITSDIFVKNKFPSTAIQSFPLRLRNLKNYLREKDFFKRASFVVLNDIFGKSLDKKFEAIFVTSLTFKNAVLINKKRQRMNLKLLEINLVPLLEGEDNKIISSERIRLGKINRNGEPNVFFKKGKNKLILPDNLREELRRPFGKVIKDIRDLKKIKAPFLISVGDIISINLSKINKEPDINIIDFKNRRKNLDKRIVSKIIRKSNYAVVNVQGSINTKAFTLLEKLIRINFKTGDKHTIIVDGEEDLLALAAILVVPLNSVVVYGLKDVGIISVEVTEEKKEEVKKIMNKFFYE